MLHQLHRLSIVGLTTQLIGIKHILKRLIECTKNVITGFSIYHLDCVIVLIANINKRIN